MYKRLNSESDHHLHVTETLWRFICDYRAFTLNHVYRSFLEKFPAAAEAKSPSPPSTSSQDHRKSAFFAFIQTLTNGYTGIDCLRPYLSIPLEVWLTSAAAYLVRYVFPSVPSAYSSPPLLILFILFPLYYYYHQCFLRFYPIPLAMLTPEATATATAASDPNPMRETTLIPHTKPLTLFTLLSPMIFMPSPKVVILSNGAMKLL